MSKKVLGSDSFSDVPDVNGVKLLLPSASSGIVLRRQVSSVAAQSGTTSVTLNNTTPAQATFGTQVWSNTITPSSASNRIEISGSFICDCSTASRLIVAALFRGAVCIGVTSNWIRDSGRPVPIVLDFFDSPNTVAAVTYTIRVGVNGSGTWFVGQGSSAYFNGLMAAPVIKLHEVA
jgi:hypothetical protein